MLLRKKKGLAANIDCNLQTDVGLPTVSKPYELNSAITTKEKEVAIGAELEWYKYLTPVRGRNNNK